MDGGKKIIMMNTVPNQKVIAVNKEMTDREHRYVKFNTEALEFASRELTKGSLFKMWVYFASNADGWKFNLSSAHVCAALNISEKTYRESIKELIRLGYLVQRAKPTNYYDFYEIPRDITVPKNGSVVECHTTTEIIIETVKVTGEI